ncbi:MAG: 50S ribosome-binding GTPase [Ardenticatenaceae bacterium]|nr:50S ribosome-binding GTPase [Ardenticatenaceae bacterium]
MRPSGAPFRAKRQQTELQVVANVGYTNAGKSTLLNQPGRSERAGRYAVATLDPHHAQSRDAGRRDAVYRYGRISFKKLPTEIVGVISPRAGRNHC